MQTSKSVENEINVGENTTSDVPAEFQGIDFKNFTYPISYNMEYTAELRRRSVRLKDGSREYPSKTGGGANYDLMDISYVDLNSDGRKEAVVRLLQVACGGSCDGGTDIFYFYSANGRRPRLLFRLEIGSFAYDCGLKSFVLNNRELAVETFRSCRFIGPSFKPTYDDPDERGGKLMTNRYTQFTLRFNGKGFAQKSRKVRAYPEDYDYRAYERRIEINH